MYTLSLLFVTISIKLNLACHDKEFLVSKNEHFDEQKFHFRNTLQNHYLLVEPETMILRMVSSAEFENAKRYVIYRI
jgi:hypothetical protein